MFVVSPRIIVINEAGRGMRPEGTSTRDWDFDPRHVPSLAVEVIGFSIMIIKQNKQPKG